VKPNLEPQATLEGRGDKAFVVGVAEGFESHIIQGDQVENCAGIGFLSHGDRMEGERRKGNKIKKQGPKSGMKN
jgi:hypothetical protein